ncbi:MAG: beta-lactamase family protein [Myxococcales bacterium]|nr:beta-lactamase family protein [Myxococcales bacterium]
MTSPPRDPEAGIGALLDDAIAGGVCSAAAAAVGAPGRRARWVRGTTRTVPDRGEAIAAATRFDLASLTKPIATATVTLALVEAGRLALDASAARWLPALDRAVTIGHLLGHASGLPAHVKLYERLWAGDLGGADLPRAALVAMASATPLERAPGAAAIYSDLGFIALAAVCERAGDAPLEELTARALAPLELAATGFVDLRTAGPRPDAPATELCPRRGLVAGEVHDENCHAAGGVAGHAGLFAPIDDVAAFAQALARGPVDGVGAIAAARIEHAFTTSAAPATSWRLGWDTPSSVAGVSHAGDAWPRVGAVGHLGFTGTSMWLDWARGRWAVLLTNRVHPARDRPEAAKIKDLRRGFGDLAWAWLEA